MSKENMPLLEDYPALKRLLHVSVLANEGEIEEKDGEWQGKGDAVDVALLFMARKAGIKKQEVLDKHPEIHRIPYESEQKYAASFHEDDDGALICVKGAVETLLEQCSKQVGEKKTEKLKKETIADQEEELSQQQYRVLAFTDGNTKQKKEWGWHRCLEHLCWRYEAKAFKINAFSV